VILDGDKAEVNPFIGEVIARGGMARSRAVSWRKKYPLSVQEQAGLKLHRNSIRMLLHGTLSLESRAP
jgi:hypothetical protein